MKIFADKHPNFWIESMCLTPHRFLCERTCIISLAALGPGPVSAADGAAWTHTDSHPGTWHQIERQVWPCQSCRECWVSLYVTETH